MACDGIDAWARTVGACLSLVKRVSLNAKATGISDFVVRATAGVALPMLADVIAARGV